MTPAAIIQAARAEGVGLILTPTGIIKATGEGNAVTRWLPLIRAHKSELLAALQHPVNDTLTTAEHQTICAWLAHIQETDPAIIAEALDKCRADPGALAYYLRRAEEIPPPDADDRHTCRACRHLRAGHCTAKRHGIEGEASFRFRPHSDLTRRCAGFVEASSC